MDALASRVQDVHVVVPRSEEHLDVVKKLSGKQGIQRQDISRFHQVVPGHDGHSWLMY